MNRSRLDVAKLIRDWRTARSWSLRRFSEEFSRLGGKATPQSVWGWERGLRIEQGNLAVVADLLGVDSETRLAMYEAMARGSSNDEAA